MSALSCLGGRVAVFSPLAVALVVASPAQAAVVDLQGAAELVTALTQAILALPDLVRKSVQTGREISGAKTATDTRNALIALSRRLTGLATSQKANMLGALDAYQEDPSPARWARFEMDLAKTVEVIGGLEARLATENSDLVLQTPYRALMQTLRSRAVLLNGFINIPPPTTAAELAELKRFETRYRRLIDDLQRATDQLNQYVATLPG